MGSLIEGGGELQHEACRRSRNAVHRRPRGGPRRGPDPAVRRRRRPVPGHEGADRVAVQAGGVADPLLHGLPRLRRPRPQQPREALIPQSSCDKRPGAPAPGLLTRARPPRCHCSPRTASLRMWQYLRTVTQNTMTPPPARTETAATRKAPLALGSGPPLVTVAATGAGDGRAGAGRVTSATAERRGVKAIGPSGRAGAAAIGPSAAAAPTRTT